METSTRFIVQVFIEGKGWTAYVAKGARRGGKYTLTSEEAGAYIKTLPTSYTLKDSEEEIAIKYRIIESVVSDGLINQKVVGYAG